MASPATLLTVPVEEYLADPRWEKAEYAAGAPVERHMGTPKHATIQLNCGALLRAFLRASASSGWASTEMRCRLRGGGDPVFRLPDVAVVVGRDEAREQPFLDGAPDLVVEVKSPEDSLAALFRKLDEYFAAGARLGWIVVPEERAVFVRRSDGTATTVLPGETIDAAPVLDGFRVPIDEFFD